MTTELISPLQYNWSKFDQWQIWTYFHWTYFDSLNQIREVADPNLFIKSSLILFWELLNLNLFITSSFILFRDFQFLNLFHWTCLNWTYYSQPIKPDILWIWNHHFFNTCTQYLLVAVRYKKKSSFWNNPTVGSFWEQVI